MLKLMLFLVRNPGTTIEEMQDYYDNQHLPLALKTFPQIKEHRRNYLTGETFFPDGVEPPPYDAISELWFEDRAALDEMLGLLVDPEIRDRVRADDARFLDPKKCGMMIVDESIGAGARRA
ncbi:MAG: EthD domain-containing protein [Sphingomonadaceae bacterium]